MTDSTGTSEFMTSWEIATEVNKSHANVLRDIRRRLQGRGRAPDPHPRACPYRQEQPIDNDPPNVTAPYWLLVLVPNPFHPLMR